MNWADPVLHLQRQLVRVRKAAVESMKIERKRGHDLEKRNEELTAQWEESNRQHARLENELRAEVERANESYEEMAALAQELLPENKELRQRNEELAEALRKIAEAETSCLPSDMKPCCGTIARAALGEDKP